MPKSTRPTDTDLINSLMRAMGAVIAADHHNVTLQGVPPWTGYVITAMSGRRVELIEMLDKFRATMTPLLDAAEKEQAS